MVVYAGCGGNGACQLGACSSAPSDTLPYDNIWPHSSSLEYSLADPITGLPGFITDDQLKNLEGKPLFYTNKAYGTMTTKKTPYKVFVRVGPYNLNPETAIDKASVISHEYGHSLGLPDFYSTGRPRDLRRLEPDGDRQVAEHGRLLPPGARLGRARGADQGHAPRSRTSPTPSRTPASSTGARRAARPTR